MGRRHEQGRYSRRVQQPQVGYGAPVQYGVPRNYASTMTVTGIDMNRDGIPDVLQQAQVGYGAPVQFGAPGTAFQTCCNSLRLAMAFPCSMDRRGTMGRR